MTQLLLGLDLSSCSFYLSPSLSIRLLIYPSISPSPGERDKQGDLNSRGSGSESEGWRERARGTETEERERSCLPCSLSDSALASLQFTCTGLDFLKLLHHRPLCQSWLLIGWEGLPCLRKLQ